MNTTNLLPSGAVKPSLREIGIVAGITVVAALVLNVILFYALDAAGMFPDEIIVEQLDGPMVASAVAFATFTSILGATVLWTLLTKFTKAPVKIFRIVAVIFLLLSFLNPFTIPNVPAKMVVGLDLLHVTTFLACVLILARPKR